MMQIAACMSRRFAIGLLVVAISGLLPVLAIGMSCDAMPCCRQTANAGVDLELSTPGCCSPQTCIKEEAAIAAFGVSAVVAVETSDVLPAPLALSAHSSASLPPSDTGERLALLSVLLI